MAAIFAVCALGLSACARHEETAEYTGSLKDGPYAKPARSVRSYKVASASAGDAMAAPKVLPSLAAKPQPMEPAPTPAAASAATPAPQPSASAVLPNPPASASAAPQAARPAAPSKAEPPLPQTVDPAAVTTLLAEGQALFESGKVIQARRRFIAAMNGPIPEVLLSLARTYDTYYLSRLPSSDATPDMQRALVLYERASERGATAAAADLERTRGILKVPPR